MASLLLRNLFFTILQPGIVAGIVPFLLIKGKKPALFGIAQVAGMAVGLAGLAVMLACIFRFATDGRGTLSPADPTKKLVKKGLYRFSRNPMYVGVMGILVGESLFFGSPVLWGYSFLVFAAFQLFIVFREEPRLRRDFGAGYDEYCGQVRRWF